MAQRLVSVDEKYIFPPPLEERLGEKMETTADAKDAASRSAWGAAIASAEGRSAMLALGPKVVSRDSDGVPYYNPTSGTLRIFVGADGKPFFAEKPWPTTSLDTDGVPAVIL